MSRGFRVNVARKRVVLPGVVLVVGLLCLAGAQAALACTAGSTGYVAISPDKDSYVAEAQPNQNYGTNLHTRAGYNANGDAWHTYVHLPTADLPNLPAGCHAIAGYIYWNPGGSPTIVDLYDSPVQTQRAAASWSETGIKWSNRPGGAGNYTISNPYLSNQAQGFLDISAPLVDIYNGSANNGIVYKPTKGLSGSWDDGTWWEASSREAVDPTLIIVYYA